MRFRFLYIFFLVLSFTQTSFSEDKILENEVVDTTLFDLFISDQYAGTALVNFTESWFQIENVSDVLEQLSQITDKDKLAQLISEKVESRKTIENFGSIHIDLNSFSLVLSIKPEFLSESKNQSGILIGDPSNNFSWQQLLRTTASGNISDNNFFSSYNHRSIGSFGKNWLRIDGTYIDNNGDSDTENSNNNKTKKYEITEFSATKLIKDYELSTGLLQSEGQFFSQSLDFAGFSFKTSEQVYLNEEALRGSKLLVYVPSRAKVDIFRGSRLLFSEILDFGLQEIDTSSFPQGSYEVETVVTEGSGIETREKQFFTKSGLLSIRTKPQLVLDFGRLRQRLDFYDEYLGKAGITWRALSFMDLDLSVYGTNDIQIYSALTRALIYNQYISTGVQQSSEDDLSYLVELNGEFEPFSWNFSIRDTIKSSPNARPHNDQVPILDDQADDFVEDQFLFDGISILSNSKRSLSGSLNIGNRDLRLRLVGRENITFSNSDRYTYGPQLEWFIVRSQSYNLRFLTSYYWTNEGEETSASLVFDYRPQKQTIISDLAYNKRDDVQEKIIKNSYTYDNISSRSRKGYRVNLQNELKNDSKKNENRITNYISGDYNNNFISTRAEIQDARSDDQEDQTVATLNAEAAFLIAKNEGLGISRPVTDESLIIVEIEGEESNDDSKIDVLVNNQVWDTLETNSKTVLGVPAFQKYSVGIRPTENSGLFDYNSNLSEVVLFPGNIAKFKWSTAKVFVAIGKIIDKDGTPLKWKRINGTRNYSMTDEEGGFQIEINGKESIYVETSNGKCLLDISTDKDFTYVYEFGVITCRY